MAKRISAASIPRRTHVIRRRASLKKRIKTFLAMSALVVLSAIAVVLIYFIVIFVQVSRDLPSIVSIGDYRPSEGTIIYYADGPVMAVLATENRRPVKLSDIAKPVLDATLAAEDSRFYEHPGVDMRGVARAIFKNVTGGEMKQGGSTITQQLARNIAEFGLTREKKLRRKVAEAILAMRLEQTYTKDEILELYLNQIYYGNGAYGIEAAARAYFHKPAKNLSISEAAMLAGLPQRPSLLSEDRERAYRRRDWVLDRMVAIGKITPEQCAEAKAEKLKMYRATPQSTRIKSAPYFVNYIVNHLVHGKGGYGYDSVYSGWKIYTTLDSRLQKAAEETLRRGIRAHSAANQAALICLDPKTGAIRAMVGGLDYKRDQFNIVTQGTRQPGSAFKPIVYTAAIDTGVCDLNKTYRDDPYFPGRHPGNTWYPKNYSGRYSYRYVSVLNAIRMSLNTIAVKVAMETGLRTVIGYAHRMGISSEIDPYPTLALGAWQSGVRPLELCSAYSVLANNGQRAIPNGIKRIVAANGDTIEENSVRLEDTQIRPTTIEAMNQALREVVLHGTGTAAAAVPEARGKTGTTSDNRDAWFAGYTPELVTVVWAGREQRDKKGKVVRYLTMPGTTGGHLCAPIWKEFMLRAVPIQQAVNKALAGQALPAPDNNTDKPEQKRQREEVTSPPPDSVELPDSVPPAGEEPAGANSDIPAASVPLPNAAPTGGGLIPPPANSGPPGTTPVSLAPVGGTSTGARPSEPGGRPAMPATRRTDAEEEVVSVRLCADSMARATRWCPVTIERRIVRGSIPRRCTVHRPPPGERD